MSLLIIGERENSPLAHVRPYMSVAKNCEEDRRRVRWLLARGAFQNEPCKERLMEHGLQWTDAMNLLWPGPEWSPWMPEAARRIATAAIHEVFHKYDGVALLGRRVHTAFGFYHSRYLTKVYHEACVVTPIWLLPHPSSRSRWWHSASHRHTATRVFSEITSEVGEIGDTSCQNHDSQVPARTRAQAQVYSMHSRKTSHTRSICHHPVL